MTVVVHERPVWRDRSNWILRAEIPDADGRREQLWAKSVGPQQFELCCIPFFLYDVALGDIVSTDGEYNLVQVVEPMGRFVFRVWFGDNAEWQPLVEQELIAAGALLEWRSPRLLAVDAANEVHAQCVADLLQAHQQAGHLQYETGKS